MSLRSYGITLAFAILLLGSPSGRAQEERMCTRVEGGGLTPEFRRTVVITRETDPKVFEGQRFSLSATLKNILSTAHKSTPNSGVDDNVQKELASSETEQVAFLASLIRSFRKLERSNQGVRNDATFRPNEAALNAADLLANMKPVGLFNRLDLAPASWRYCEEHRVVFARGTGTERIFLIFEAALDNPDPTHARAGCLRIARFWNSLRTMPEDQRPDALQNFYFNGDLRDGQGKIKPVLDNQHFGVPFGQVRGNLFLTGGDVDANPWMLREWRTFPSTESSTVFIPDTVKSNPNSEFYSSDPIRTGPTNKNRTQAFVDLRPEFQEEFKVSTVRELIEVDLNAALAGRRPSGNDIFNGVSATFDDRFNDFESISQDPRNASRRSDDPFDIASAELREAIRTELRKFKLPPDWQLTPEHILARASALSCGGCHFSNRGNPVGPGEGDSMRWPADAGFVHITETGRLSPALDNNFLPARCEDMQRFLRDFAPAAAEEVARADDLGKMTAARESEKSLRSLEGVSERATALATLSQNVDAARQADSLAPGAFRRFRRTH